MYVYSGWNAEYIFCLSLIHLCTAGIFYANLIMKRADIVKFSKGLYSAPSSFMYSAVSNFEKKSSRNLLSL